ncbi:hypothetical protein IMZ48_44705 [Candidatus Bathyarchaeota archaeon]|nr:hypothetical protein [Candidatus Bathyarchaeota archaeon]
MFQRLVSLGADVGARDNLGRNILHHIADCRDNAKDEACYKSSLQTILASAPNLLEKTDGEGQTPLHYAALGTTSCQKTELAKTLLSAGANANAADENGDTALHILARDLNTVAQRALFEDIGQIRGADVNACNTLGETPLFEFSGRPDKYYNVEPLGEGAVPMLERLGVDFCARDNRGRGVLHVAASGRVERFRELMDMGLDVMLEDETHQTAIDVPAACDNMAVLELFEKVRSVYI